MFTFVSVTRRLAHEGLATKLARIRALSTVNAFMLHKVSFLDKTFEATLARERALSSMNAFMMVAVIFPKVTFGAILARERPHSSMHTFVSS